LADRCRRSGLARQPGKKTFVYMFKVCELITHIKKFKGTKTLVKDLA
jgi:hypothetical protein